MSYRPQNFASIMSKDEILKNFHALQETHYGLWADLDNLSHNPACIKELQLTTDAQGQLKLDYQIIPYNERNDLAVKRRVRGKRVGENEELMDKLGEKFNYVIKCNG